MLLTLLFAQLLVIVAVILIVGTHKLKLIPVGSDVTTEHWSGQSQGAPDSQWASKTFHVPSPYGNNMSNVTSG